ncbi:MAG: glycosyltransferase [Chitinophagaceae bacterium]|nr:MAG: glycosyltransferase [Chitinophagaceae bacterium]
MKKVLILCVHRPNRSPSQRFRFEQYLDHLRQNGYEIHFSYLLNEKQDKAFYKPGQYLVKLWILFASTAKRIKELLQIGKYDLVYVQREAYMLGTAFFEKQMAKKVPLIFDFDDSIWLQKVSEGNKKLGFLKNANKTAELVKAAQMVWAGNEYLAQYARNLNNQVVVIPTTIDLDVYQREPSVKDGRICIGWSGSFSTIEHFQTAIPALLRIKNKYRDKVHFSIVGDGRYYCKELDTQGKPWQASTEIKDLSQMDIGIMPLPDDEWANGKCGLKGLQYMSLGIPTLMSPVGVNSEIVQNGVNGYLPVTEDDWVNYLSLLIEDEALRKRIGDAGMQTVREKYSTQSWKNKYLHYFNQLTSDN